MKPGRNRNETGAQDPVSPSDKAAKAFLVKAGQEAAAYEALVDWRCVPGIELADPRLARKARAISGAHPVQWSQPGRRKLDSWGNLIDRGRLSDAEVKAGGELLQIVEALSTGNGLGSRDPFAERVDRSYDAGLDGRERIVGLYQARYLPWLKSMARREARQGRPSAGYPDQAYGIVCVSCVFLVLVFGASLRAIDARARKRPGTSIEHLVEGLQTYGHFTERRSRRRVDEAAKLQRPRS